MSKKIRSLVVALVACGFTAFMVLPWTTAQEKSSGQAKKGGPVATDSTSSKSTAKSQPAKNSEAAAEKSVGTNDEAPTKSNKTDKSSAASKTTSKSPKATGNTLRLPRYFSGIVDQEQREAIYAIQLEYRAKIAELEEELDRVRQDELAALEELLTDSQRKILAKKRSQAQDSVSAKAAEAESADSTME